MVRGRGAEGLQIKDFDDLHASPVFLEEFELAYGHEFEFSF